MPRVMLTIIIALLLLSNAYTLYRLHELEHVVSLSAYVLGEVSEAFDEANAVIETCMRR